MVIIQEKVPGLSTEALTRFLTRARRAAGLKGAVSVLLTSSRELQRLNHRFRGKNKPTDVLSFPAMPRMIRGFAGDVAISAEIAARNARRLGHTAAEEIRILILHGLLHLAGHDHERDHGEMERQEARLRKTMGLPGGLIERSRQSARGKLLRPKSNRPPSAALRGARSAKPTHSPSFSGSRATRASR